LFHLVLESHDGRALVPIPKRSTSPVSDIDTAAADSGAIQIRRRVLPAKYRVHVHTMILFNLVLLVLPGPESFLRMVLPVVDRLVTVIKVVSSSMASSSTLSLSD
jgi:hypothetical protein